MPIIMRMGRTGRIAFTSVIRWMTASTHRPNHTPMAAINNVVNVDPTAAKNQMPEPPGDPKQRESQSVSMTPSAAGGWIFTT